MPLSRREIILTQLCILKHKDTDLVSQAMREIPQILEALGVENTTPEEIYNYILELQISRTEIALRMYIGYFSERDKPFRFFPVRAFWTKRINRDPLLILNLRGEFDESDSYLFYDCRQIQDLITGSCFMYLLTPENITVEYLEKSDILSYLKSTFKTEDTGDITKFLLSGD